VGSVLTAEDEPTSALESAADLTTRVVLVVEDEVQVRQSIASELRAFGWLVLEAATGEQAVALAPDNQIDAVFTDIQLGDGISGWETAVALRAKRPSIPILYTSAGRCEPERQVSGSLFVSKPYEPAFIIETCNSLFEDRG
jgi:two-component system, response regulator PdtaR